MAKWKVYKIETPIIGGVMYYSRTIRTWDGKYVEAETWDEAINKTYKSSSYSSTHYYAIPEGWEYPFGDYMKQLELF